MLLWFQLLKKDHNLLKKRLEALEKEIRKPHAQSSSGWRKRKSMEHGGEAYFYHEGTGAVQWEVPEGSADIPTDDDDE